MNLFNTIVSWYIKQRIDQIQWFVKNPIEAQERVFHYLLRSAAHTEWGHKYDYGSIYTVREFKNRVPIQTYEGLKPAIERTMQGEENVLWPGEIKWFAKSSGTTSDKSKFIPVTQEAMEECHFKAGKDVLATYLENYPNSEIFAGKGLVMGGSNKVNQLNDRSYYGDVSAVMMQNMPFLAQLLRTPDLSIALMDEWEAKIDRMAEQTIHENVTHIAGVPSWTMVLIRKIFELTGKDNLADVWPNLQLYIHGGVSFTPYREQYKQVIRKPDMHYLETYNASEGFIALQNDGATNDLLLMLDYGIFYEFLPMEEVGKDDPKTLQLEEVELGKPYALIISTNAGLWRYQIGDTVRFTSKYPFKIEVAGRVKHFMNAFGEEVIVDNAEKALAEACHQTGATMRDFTAAPLYMEGNSKGAHEWLIEFEHAPDNLQQFTEALDKALQAINSDYEAKRYKGMVLDMPRVHQMPEGSFHQWLKKKGKLGGQHKVPRLCNERKYVEEILSSVDIGVGKTR